MLRAKVFLSIFLGYGQRKWAKRLAVFHEVVAFLFHVPRARRGQQAAVAERAWPEFRSSLEKGHDFTQLQQADGFGKLQIFGIEPAVGRFAIIKDEFYLCVRVRRTPKRSRAR